MLLAQKKINKYLSLFLPCLWSFLSINCPYSYFHSHDSAWLNATLYKHQEYYYHGLAGGGGVSGKGCLYQRKWIIVLGEEILHLGQSILVVQGGLVV